MAFWNVCCDAHLAEGGDHELIIEADIHAERTEEEAAALAQVPDEGEGSDHLSHWSGEGQYRPPPLLPRQLVHSQRAPVELDESDELTSSSQCRSLATPQGDASSGEGEDSFSSVPGARRLLKETSPSSVLGLSPVPHALVSPLAVHSKVHDDYEFFDEIGHGSFGRVKVVRHRRTSQLRACKIVKARTQEQLEQLLTEVKLLRSLDHPNIVKLHAVYVEQEEPGVAVPARIYLVTELCEGGDIALRINYHYREMKKPMTESQVAHIMQQLLAATAYCHDIGVVHRDLKPENVLFMDRGPYAQLKLIDFGLSNFLQRLGSSARTVVRPRPGMVGRFLRAIPKVKFGHVKQRVMQQAGTVHYMAPEIADGTYDEKADLFSIGIIFSQLLAGHHPFCDSGDSPMSCRAKITSPNPAELPKERFSGVPTEALELCRGLLEKRPSKRLSATASLEHPWLSRHRQSGTVSASTTVGASATISTSISFGVTEAGAGASPLGSVTCDEEGSFADFQNFIEAFSNDSSNGPSHSK